MAKTSYLDIPDGYDALFFKGLQSGDRFTIPRIRVKSQFLSRAKIKNLTLKSLAVSEAPAWAALSDAERAAWSAAGAAAKMTGFTAFIHDIDYRRKAGVSGYATPSTLYQALVGALEISAPATGLQIEQPHPYQYFVQKKIPGTRDQFSPVPITESFGLPLTIAISWSTALTSLGAGSGARFFAKVFSSYQGLSLETIVQIPFGLSDAWQRTSATLSSVVGPVTGYAVYIEVVNCTGTLYFDDVSIEHNSQNWARDPNCNSIQSTFTKAFAQVPRHWAATNLTDGAGFHSVYFH